MSIPTCPAPAVLATDSSGAVLCTDGSAPVAWEAVVSVESFDPSLVDPLIATGAFGAGFALYATFWVAASAIVLAVRSFVKL